MILILWLFIWEYITFQLRSSYRLPMPLFVDDLIH